MTKEFGWRDEHTAHAEMFRFSERVVNEYGPGVDFEHAKDDALTYASLLLEHFWDNRKPKELAEEIEFRKKQILRWTNVLDQAARDNLEPLKEEIEVDAHILIVYGASSEELGKALLNLANSINS
ncbi:hypothetical protein A2W45_03955 [Candidatus Curtissbacteria bacterium RIFCSPHIGHO2_12_41_11]|uniref:Uncharacterized protein n=2 Tax=Candidatus Curtissiibacteriota TaxID=1752717 RepID=A0A1F5H9P1_9BACT|nr:MAG: hypothetical protein A3D07_02260 [Candidatus Curtissbacteria bacterium RIFCSPHIGHO2_02_FULL_42_15]OGE00752.1 MAG: hypothetical protein A2W45_03955 [Candidatus Curtissbacteria bacterium RIFCSPHIGHO2_12_41_11]